MSAIPKHIRRGDAERNRLIVDWAVKERLFGSEYRTVYQCSFDPGSPPPPEGNRAERRAQRAKDRRLKGKAAWSSDQSEPAAARSPT